MSGKDLEPLTAFFPSIDRNLMRDLERHLRGDEEPAESGPPAPPPAAVGVASPEPPGQAARVDITGVLEAVEHAASSMSAMAERINELEAHGQALESHIEALQSQNQELATRLDETSRHRDSLADNLKTEGERVQRLEGLAAHHVSRATGLERDLGLARSDLARVVDAITSALGAPGGPSE